MKRVSVSLYVHTDDPQKVAKSAEVLARTAAGLVMEGIDVSVVMYELDEEEVS